MPLWQLMSSGQQLQRITPPLTCGTDGSYDVDLLYIYRTFSCSMLTEGGIRFRRGVR